MTDIEPIRLRLKRGVIEPSDVDDLFEALDERNAEIERLRTAIDGSLDAWYEATDPGHAMNAFHASVCILAKALKPAVRT